MLKKKFALALTLVMGIGLLSGCSDGSTDSSTSASSSKDTEIKVGVIMALTGGISTFGQSGKNGLMLLEDQVNKDGGVNGKKVKFIYEDDEGKPANSATVGQKLIDNDKVVAIIGPLTSGCCLSFAPIAQAAKIPMITGTGTNPKVTDAGDFIFRTCFMDPFQGTVVAKFASEDLKAKTAAIIYDNGNDYSKGLADNFKASFEKDGGTVVAQESYNTNDQDFNAQLTKIKPKNADVMFIPDYYNTVGLITKQARAQGIKSTFLGADGWDSADLVKIAGDSVNGGYYSNHYSSEDTSPEVQKFITDYKAKFNAIPDTMAVLNYDAGKILIEAIKNAGGKTDGDSLKAALLKTDTTVASGKIKFDDKRNAVKSAVMVKVENGVTKFAKKINP